MWKVGFPRSLKHSMRITRSGRLKNAERWCSGESRGSGSRFNELRIQMLSPSMHSQIFKHPPPSALYSRKSKEIERHLSAHGLWNKPTTTVDDVSFELPKMKGENIDEHFRTIAQEVNGPYVELARRLQVDPPPMRPKRWAFRPGWTRYDPKTGKVTAVEYPACDALVFDVEVLVLEGHFPTMATAVSPEYWYSWCSGRVFDQFHYKKTEVDTDDLINLEKNDCINLGRHSLVVGHNVGFDRSFIKEQYHIDKKNTKFLDTMSMHIAVAGLTNMQRILFMTGKREDKGFGRKEVREHYKNKWVGGNLSWTAESSLNNLRDVHQLYCPHEARLQKETRDTFLKGKMRDVRDCFQELMDYCAADVAATHSVFRALWPEFCERFPHPVTLAGMLEMSTTYLPINDNWASYKNAANEMYFKYEREMQESLMKLADDALTYAADDKYKKDLWLWDLDWSPKTYHVDVKYKYSTEAREVFLRDKKYVRRIEPAWYAELCPRPSEYSDTQIPGKPSKISTRRRVTPKLLRLTWKGYPVHYDETYKWGYLVPDSTPTDAVERELEEQAETGDPKEPLNTKFPLKEFLEFCAKNNGDSEHQFESSNVQILERKLDSLAKEIDSCLDESTSILLMRELKEVEKEITKTKQREKKRIPQPDNDGSRDIGIPGVRFFCLPHKSGPANMVGNPLAKDFLPRIDDGTLRCTTSADFNDVLKYSNVVSYWKSTRKRIEEQMCVMLPGKAEAVSSASPEKTEAAPSRQGAIIPRLVTAGTVTRRAVEATWLTASNAYEDRVGSELKAMIQSPVGYRFVGADVDSQELWIAAIIGDAQFGGIHGCTAFGWMTLQGNKKDGTDLHSKTASLVGISRDQAKIFNYGRIYGAGEKFARQLLKQFNSNLTEEEVITKAREMYLATKGKQRRSYTSPRDMSGNAAPTTPEVTERWYGGSESAMFNKLESIARSEAPSTPALDARISKALEPHSVSSDFITSRINWVVQSSGVDYLHLILVSMRWLFQKYGIDGRFSVSIHDEVRYLVREEDKYRAALALQITNLYTRSLFAYKLGMNDLPQSVAFFSAVDIDTCLRKEVFMDCKTPSNPHGLEKGYGIEPGEALPVADILEKTGASLAHGERVEEKSDSMLAQGV